MVSVSVLAQKKDSRSCFASLKRISVSFSVCPPAGPVTAFRCGTSSGSKTLSSWTP